MVNPFPTPPAPSPPSSRRALHQARQREATRARLLAAAQEVFAEHGYLAASVEQILLRAQVSRAGFYAHFQSKLALVVAIAEAFMPQWLPLYDRLAAIPPDDLAGLTRWASEHVEIYRKNSAICILLTQVVALEKPLYAVLSAQQDALIRRLAAAIPAFDRALEDPAMRTRATLLLANFDQSCFTLCHRRPDLDEQAAARMMAEELRLFLLA